MKEIDNEELEINTDSNKKENVVTYSLMDIKDREIEIYNTLPTMEDKLEFIVKSYILHFAMCDINSSSGNSKFNYEILNWSDSLTKLFTDEYLKSASDNTYKRIAAKLSSLLIPYEESCEDDYQEILKQFDKDDNKETKAYYIAKSINKNSYPVLAIRKVNGAILDQYNNDKIVDERLKKELNISDKTTYKEYLAMMGIKNKKEIEDNINANNNYYKTQITADTLALDFLVKRLDIDYEHQEKHSKKDAADQIIRKVKDHRFHEYGNEALVKHYRDRGYSKEETNQAVDQMIGYSKEPEAKKLYKWTHREAKDIIAKYNQKSTDIIKAYYMEYSLKKVNELKENKEIADASILRKNKPVKERYKFMTGNPDDFVAISDKQKKEIEYDLNINNSQKIAKEMDEVLAPFNNAYYVKRINNVHRSTRSNSLNSLFIMWVLGTHEDVELANITGLSKNAKLLEEYASFCEKHPTAGANNSETYYKSTKVWGEVYKKAVDKVMNYKIPEIDYTNQEEVKSKLLEFNLIHLLALDYMQDIKSVFSNRLEIDPVEASMNSVGFKTWSKMFNTMARFQCIFSNVKDGALSDISFRTKGYTYMSIARIASNRELFRNRFSNYAGKTIKELSEGKGYYIDAALENAGYYQNVIDDRGLAKKEIPENIVVSREEYIDYLKGGDAKSFKTKLKKQGKISMKRAAKQHTEAFVEAGTLFNSQLDLTDIKSKLSNVITAEDVIALLTSEEKIEISHKHSIGTDKILARDIISMNINHLFTDGFVCGLGLVGLDKMDVFEIDGKSVKELWGDKYKNVEDEELKNRCYEAEILKTILDKKLDVNYKPIETDGDTSRVADSLILYPNEEKLKELVYNFDLYSENVDSLIALLGNYRDKLLKTHPDFANKSEQDLIEEVGEIGSDNFKDMELNLYKCILMLEDDHPNSGHSFNKILAMLNMLNEAVNDYVGERESIFKGSEDSQTRYDVANALKADLPVLISSYMLSYQKFDYNIAYAKNKMLKDTNYGEIKSFINDYKDKGISYDFNDVKIDEAEKLANINVLRHSVCVELTEELKNIGKDLNKLLTLDKKSTAYDSALAYMVKGVFEKMSSKNTSIEDINKIKEDLVASFSDGSFKKKAEKLSKNPVFLKHIKEYEGLDYKEWKTIDKKSEDMVNKYKTNIRRLGDNAAMYVLTGGAKLSPSEKTINKSAKEIITERYDRLADYVAKQMLIDPKNIVIVNAINARKMDYKSVVKDVNSILKKQKIFESVEFNLDTIKQKIENKAFVKAVEGSLTKQAKERTNLINSRIKPSKDLTSPMMPK
ncbi:MAG: hypothetical protein K5656_09640 [Lachnospiraceae bacterium]|nr:hypothetical protein [Lachnospiraceae bacterium]